MVARLLWVSESKRSMSVLTKGSAQSKELKKRLTATRNDYATAQGVQNNYTENLRGRKLNNRDVAQMVARLLWEQDVAGSNPVIPTNVSVRKDTHIF